MEEEKLPPQLKKNVLDLQYTKYLQYFTTTVIILFTYFICLFYFRKQMHQTVQELKQLK